MSSRSARKRSAPAIPFVRPGPPHHLCPSLTNADGTRRPLASASPTRACLHGSGDGARSGNHSPGIATDSRSAPISHNCGGLRPPGSESQVANQAINSKQKTLLVFHGESEIHAGRVEVRNGCSLCEHRNDPVGSIPGAASGRTASGGVPPFISASCGTSYTGRKENGNEVVAGDFVGNWKLPGAPPRLPGFRKGGMCCRPTDRDFESILIIGSAKYPWRTSSSSGHTRKNGFALSSGPL